VRPRWLLAAAGLGLGASLGAPLALRAAAGVLVAADPVAPADALFLFPGEVPRRARCTAALFAAGVAPRVVASGGRVSPLLAAAGLPLTDAELNARLLRQLGVPGDAVAVVNEGTSTREDAAALRRWANGRAGLRRIVAVTSPAHSRRARRTLRRAFADTAVDVRVHACPDGVAADWWRHEDTLLQVTNEYLKLAYYALTN
jgi:uncharacterized SAM-binding protein YcdF (DUF218 family)